MPLQEKQTRLCREADPCVTHRLRLVRNLNDRGGGKLAALHHLQIYIDGWIAGCILDYYMYYPLSLISAKYPRRETFKCVASGNLQCSVVSCPF